MKRIFSKITGVTILLCFITVHGYGQEKCGTMQHLEMQKAQNPQLENQIRGIYLVRINFGSAAITKRVVLVD